MKGIKSSSGIFVPCDNGEGVGGELLGSEFKFDFRIFVEITKLKLLLSFQDIECVLCFIFVGSVERKAHREWKTVLEDGYRFEEDGSVVSIITLAYQSKVISEVNG